jgi:peptide/nickel transport system substrate-binding protein
MSCAVFRAAPVREFFWAAGATATRMIAHVAGVAVAIALLAPQPAPAAEVSRHGGILEFASTVEPGNYDCHGNTSFAFLHPVAPHYSTLLKFDAANYPQIVGDLAQSWEVSADRQTYTFRLRPNVLFHDGSRLTSADIKASYQRIIHPPQGVTPHRGRSISAPSRRSTRPTR